MEELSRPTRSLVRADTGSTGYPSPVGQASGLTRGRAAVPADSDPGPKSCGDDQLSRPTLPGFEPTRGHPGSRAHAVPGPRSCGLHPRPRPTLSWSELARARPAVQADLDPGPRGCGPAILPDSVPCPSLHRVDHLSWTVWSRVQADVGVAQLSRTTWSRVRGVVGSTRCPGRPGPQSEELWGRPAVQADSFPRPS